MFVSGTVLSWSASTQRTKSGTESILDIILFCLFALNSESFKHEDVDVVLNLNVTDSSASHFGLDLTRI